jgi:energy-coupling factor transporter ATP-binding protein EcfA2
VDPWTIPTAGVQLYKHRDEIRGIWQRIDNRLRGEKAIVAVTGLPGVGKSVLVDHLTGVAASERYHPPDQSRLVERGLRRARGLRMLLRVIPGQESPIRIQGFGDLFNAKRPVAGLIHVVANGFSDVRSDYAKTQLHNQMNLAEFKASQLEAEIDDLKVTLEYVRAAMQRRSDPFWIVVAVNKADLFAADQDFTRAQRHYTHADGRFSQQIEAFAKR